MIYAAMLRRLIATGRWLSGISDPSQLTNDENVASILSLARERVMGHDFHPVPEPALGAVHAVQTSGKRDGLAQMRHVVCAEAEPIAHACADLDADHAGPLRNKSEDRYQAFIASAPQAMATVGNRTIGVMRLAGGTDIAPALRRRSIHPSRPPGIVMGAGIK